MREQEGWCGKAYSHIETSDGVQELNKHHCQKEIFVFQTSEPSCRFKPTKIVRDNRRVVEVDHPS
jgi:hypothetical protein